jgi:glycosyltransferase involved in cell wall biosynthesis
LHELWTAAVVLGTHQGCPNAVLEAMAAGIPVIANDSGGTRELVTAGATGWLLGEDAPIDGIVAAMQEAFSDPSRAAAMAHRAREHVRTHQTIEAMASRYLAVLAPETAAAHEKISAWIPVPESPPTFASPASSP